MDGGERLGIGVRPAHFTTSITIILRECLYVEYAYSRQHRKSSMKIGVKMSYLQSSYFNKDGVSFLLRKPFHKLLDSKHRYAALQRKINLKAIAITVV